MSRFLLDTNVLSEVLKKRPAPSVLDRLEELDDDELTTSSVTVMELRYGRRAIRMESGCGSGSSTSFFRVWKSSPWTDG